MPAPFRRRSTHRRGQALVEFALVIPVFLVLMVALFDLGRAVFAYNTLTNAAREGARMRALGYSTTDATARVQSAMIGVNSSSYSIQYNLVQGAGAGTVTTGNCPTNPLITDRVRVTVTTMVGGTNSFDWLFPLPISVPVLSSQSEMRCGG